MTAKRDRPVEVTDEMEAAGMDAMREYDSAHDSSGEYAKRVYRAMRVLEPEKKSSR